MTTTTNSAGDDESMRLARKAVYVRSLTDPLAAKGFRKPFERLERERRARRLTALAALTSFAGLFGFLIATSDPPAPAVIAPASASTVIAEIPIPGSGPNDPETIVRILLPDQPPRADVRTRSS